MREIKKRWIFLPLCLLLAVVLSACGEDQHVPKEERKEGVLTYAVLDPLTSDQKRRILNFNAHHPDAQIEVLDYSDEGGVDRLLTELALGWVPDIMELRRLGGKESLLYYYAGDKETLENEYWLPYRQLARKGYLEDLWPYIENDPQLGREGVLEAPLKAAEVDGGLYMLFKEVSINTLIGDERVVGDRDGWTLEELMETFSTMPDGSTILRYNATRWEMYSKLFSATLDRYIDWETGQCSFDNGEFRSMLEFLGTFPTEFETSLTARELKEELTWRRLYGEQMVEQAVIYWLLDVADLDITFGGERVAYVGYPTTDGSSGSFFKIYGNVQAMASTCRNKEVAWEFISSLIRPVYSVQAMFQTHLWLTMAMPVNRQSYENGIAADFLPRPDTVGDPGRIIHTFPDGPEFPVDPPTDEDRQRYEKLVSSTTQLYWPDDALAEIIWEAAGPYFAGDKTMDETIQMVQNRVKLYVNENR